MYKTIRTVHLWLSVPAGLIISMICLTGLILLFDPHEAGGSKDFFFDVMKLHRWLFDMPSVKGAMTAGKMVVAVSTCCFAVIMLTGIVLWWERARKNMKRNLSISFRQGFNVFLTQLHTSGGIYVALFLLVMALTGLTWSFGWYRTFFNALFGIEKGSHVVYMIHSGAFGGCVTWFIWLVSTLVGFTLPLTGYYLWINRILKKKS